jgi:hypothetical protein
MKFSEDGNENIFTWMKFSDDVNEDIFTWMKFSDEVSVLIASVHLALISALR